MPRRRLIPQPPRRHGESCPSIDFKDVGRRLDQPEFSCEWVAFDIINGGARTIGLGVFKAPDPKTLRAVIKWCDDPVMEDDPEIMDFVIEETYSRVGGARKWFTCPKGNHRVLKLFYWHDSWACRTCHDLVNASQRVDARVRATQTVLDLGHLKAGRPRGMHEATYQSKLAKLKKAEELVTKGGRRYPNITVAKRVGTEWQGEPTKPSRKRA